MPEPSRAVFLSYASQDAAAAERICESLRSAGIEVWFDKSELRGGDAWDQSIRRQIKTCTLLLPIISRNTHARAEGYFRLEWKLAVDRSHLMMANKAFLLPVVIDDIGDDDEHVPEKFKEVQWTRLPGGQTSPAFVEHIKRLLSGDTVPMPESTRARADTPAEPAPADRGAGLHRGVLYVAVATAAIVALGLLAVGYLGRLKQAGLGAASIAVLPLANESGEPDQQYFSDGISEDLITVLGKLPGLKVIGRSSAFQFRDSKEDSRSIGSKLGVAHLLEGSVRKSGDMVRVSAELIDTSDGSTQWSERYDRAYKDLFALQDEITAAVAESLKTKLLPREQAVEQNERPPSGNIEAYNALLHGRFYARRNTEADHRKAIELYTQATDLDEYYALAWGQLARSWTELGGNFLSGSASQEAFAKAREAADRAVAVGPELPLAHLVRGDLLQTADLDWHGAEAEYSRALALAPNDPAVQFDYGIQVAALGDVNRAIDLTNRALSTEPLRANWYSWLAMYLLGTNHLDEAERAIRRAIELQPRAANYYGHLASIEIKRGRVQDAIDAAQREPAGLYQDVSLALARQIGADRLAADAALRAVIAKSGDAAPYQIAEMYALRNDPDGTFEWLDRAWSNRDEGIGQLLYDPFILRFKQDPRFAAFCRKAGLPLPGGVTAKPT